MKVLKKVFQNFEEYISSILFATMVILIFLQIVFRFVIDLPLRWTEEAARYVLVFLVYISACSGVKKEKHIRIEAIHDALPPRFAFAYWISSNVIWFAFNAAMAYYGMEVALQIYASHQLSPVLHMPMGILYMVIPLCFTIMDIRIVQLIVSKIKQREKGIPVEAISEDRSAK